MGVDDITDYGITRMDDGAIEAYLASQSIGILALPAEDAPLMRPMSFWFDGDGRVYLVYVLTAESRKEALTDRADTARFLVYSTDTPFNWRSVLLTGTVRALSGDEREAVEEEMEIGWRPDVFERASSAKNTRLYEFDIDEQAGVKHNGLPPEFERSRE